MTSGRHLSWDRVVDLLNLGAPFRHRIPGVPVVDLLGQANAAEMSIILESSSRALPRVKLANIYPRHRLIEGVAYVEVATSSRRLYEEFYYFAMSVADEIQLRGTVPLEAVERKLGEWEQLLAPLSILSPEEQIGLWGELWMLKRLGVIHGHDALSAWVGPHGEAHDFREGDTEFEVKTTRNRRRVHAISDLRQLTPTIEHTLYLVSLQVEPAGLNAGLTLPAFVRMVEASLNSSRGAEFQGLLDGIGYSKDHEDHYATPWQLSSPASLVPVDDSCPRLTSEMLRGALHGSLWTRVSRVQYVVDVDALGVADAHPEFLKVLPSEPS
jgi:hypothetical protein